MKTEKKPWVSKDLIDYLESTFPDRLPSPTATHQVFIQKAAQVDVVKHLRSIYDSQESEDPLPYVREDARRPETPASGPDSSSD